MYISSYVGEISKSIEQAKLVHLSPIEYNEWNVKTQVADGPLKTKRLDDSDIDVYCFPQIWGSTALGFGGWGGSSITSAVTVVVTHGAEAVVYFGGRFAYKVKKYGDKLMKDVSIHQMSDVKDSSKYEVK
jgi:hypothetical protein